MTFLNFILITVALTLLGCLIYVDYGVKNGAVMYYKDGAYLCEKVSN